MMVMSAPRSSAACVTICPTRPKPITSTLPHRSCAASTPSIDSGAGRARRLCSATISGVKAIDSTMMAVMVALISGVMTRCDKACAYSTKANSPPCAMTMARSSASARLLLAKRATA